MAAVGPTPQNASTVRESRTGRPGTTGIPEASWHSYPTPGTPCVAWADFTEDVPILARPISRRICDRAGECEEGALCSVRVLSIVMRASLPKYKRPTASSIITTESERISPLCKTTRRRPNGRSPPQMMVSLYLNIPVPFPTWFPSIHRSLHLPSQSSSIPDIKACKAANTLVREKQCPSNVCVRLELRCMQLLIVYPEAPQDQACMKQMFLSRLLIRGAQEKLSWRAHWPLY